ncbi:YdcH family protein [Xanthobacter sediminis]
MTSDEERDLKVLLERLRQEHRDLDVAIEALTGVAGSDVLQLQRLKKRKLQLKDRITHLEDQLFPDIIA